MEGLPRAAVSAEGSGLARRGADGRRLREGRRAGTGCRGWWRGASAWEAGARAGLSHCVSLGEGPPTPPPSYKIV